MLEKPSVWIDDGVLFSEYVDTMTTRDILKKADIAVKILDEAKIEVIPFVMILTNVDESRFHVQLPDYGKILLSTTFFKRVTGIWTVGAPENLKHSVIPTVSRFFGQRFYFMNSLEEAIIEAKKSLVKPTPMLE